MKQKILLVAVAIMCCTMSFAKGVQRPQTYNFQRGMEALRSNDLQQALDYFNKELKDNPKCGYSHAMISSIRFKRHEYGMALTAANKGIRYMPKADKEYLSWIYSVRAEVYANLKDTAAAISDFSQAIKIEPTNCRYYENRADLYFWQGNYNKADADYKKMIKMDENDAVSMGYMGIGRNLKEQNQEDDAIAVFTKVISLYPDYSSGYSFRAECLLRQKKYPEAVNDIIKALEIDDDQKAYYLMTSLDNKEAFALIQNKFRLQSAVEPNNFKWLYYQGIALKCNEQYKEAIGVFKKLLKRYNESTVNELISDCYESLGDYERALQYMNHVLEMDSLTAFNYYKRGNLYAVLGDRQRAISEMNKALELNPEESLYGYYYRRGWLRLLEGQLEEAIDDYNLAITINPEYNYAYNERGRAYLLLGKNDLARADFEKQLTFDTIPNGGSCAAYAYHFLGQDDKAIEYVYKVLKNDSTDYYLAACVYSLVNQPDSALYYLRKALDNGWFQFAHLQVDRDLDNIRNLEEYIQLVSEYEARHKASLDSLTIILPEDENRVVEVPFLPANGVTKVDCTINGLPLNFIFDTGASDVSLSQVEANFMYKNGYLSEKDIIGKQRYQTADGSISVGTVINLRQINFGGVELTNVRASVVSNQKAPLLLGQSVLQRLGKIEIDNERRILKITTNQ